MTDSPTAIDPPQSDRSRWTALYVLCAGVLMIVLDATIVNVALPSIQDDLDFSQSNLAWVVNAYVIAFGGLLLLAGRLGDLIGQRRVFLIGLGVFTVASLLCAVAPSQGMLIGARFVQGVGGALASAVVLLDRVPKGRAEDDSLPHPGMWWRRHDEYEDARGTA